MRKSFKRRQGKTTTFNPSHEEISKATQEFLKQGGAIKVVDHVEEYYDEFVSHPDTISPADDFLMGN